MKQQFCDEHMPQQRATFVQQISYIHQLRVNDMRVSCLIMYTCLNPSYFTLQRLSYLFIYH